MGEDPSTGSAAVTGMSEPATPATDAHDPQQIEREIEQTRAQLGDTVEALAHKTDVKAQARQKLQETKVSMTQKREQLLGKAKQATPEDASTAAAQVSQRVRQNPLPLAAVGAFAAGFLTGRLTGR